MRKFQLAGVNFKNSRHMKIKDRGRDGEDENKIKFALLLKGFV